MQNQNVSRRQFLEQSAVLAGATLLGPLAWRARSAESSPRGKRTANDQVALGKTGLKLSRLGIGTGSNSGNVQFGLGKETFIKLIRYAYDQGITYLDCAQGYRTFEWIGDAVKDLPREKIFLQSKISGQPANIMETIDRHRRTFKTDYVDSLLIHCMVKDQWTDEWKRMMDVFDEAKAKQMIRAKGVSCHSLPALRAATASPWTDVHLVRVNPQAKWIDGPAQDWNQSGDNIEPVMKEIKTMHAKGHGVIGMKIIGNGEFTNPADREKSIRFAMSCPDIDAVVIGFKSPEEIDEAIKRMNLALAESA